MTETELGASPEVLDVVPYISEGRESSKYLGSLSIPDVLGVPSDADETLDFETAHVFAIDAQDATEQQMIELRLGGEPLHAERFLNLLEAIAPTPLAFRETDSMARAILADWVVYESDEPHLRYLAEAHSGLRGWTQLGREYPDIKAALEPADSFRLLPWMMPGEEEIIRPAEFMYHWGDADGLANDPLISGGEFVQLLTDVYGADEARTRIIEAMRHVEPKKIQEGDPDLTNADSNEFFELFSTMDIEMRNRLVSVSDIQGHYINGGKGWSRSAQTERFTELYLDRHCVTFEAEDGQLMYTHGISPGFDLDRAYAERRRVYYGNDRPRLHGFDKGMAFEYELMDVSTVVGDQAVIIPGSVKFQQLGLVPTVRWTVEPNGKRKPQHLPEHHPLTSYKQNVLSNVAGYMVLAYLQPNRRSHWPKEARLPRLEATQEMGPAQVPLIALQQSSRLLNNDLMREAEGLI